jgi:hypothetical protein
MFNEIPNECEFRKTCNGTGFIGCWSTPSYRGECSLFIELKLKQVKTQVEVKENATKV